MNGRSITPGVIEPSFGIGRILYCLLEHCFYWRPDDEQRLVLRLTPLVAPIKAFVFPLMVDERFAGSVQKIASELTSAGIFNKARLTTGGGKWARCSATPARLILAPYFSPTAFASCSVRSQVDNSGVSIGKRYARTDELGVPFAITVDHTTVQDQTVTLRERDSTMQVRVPGADIKAVLKGLCEGELAWEAVAAKYPKQEAAAEKE